MCQLETHLSNQLEGFDSFFWHRVRWYAVSRGFPKESPFKVLDIGAGAGFLGIFLKRDFPAADYFFNEPIAVLETHLGKLYGQDRNLKNVERYVQMGIITLLDVLEHQPDDFEFLRDLVHKMDPGAKLIITVPALQYLWSKWDQSLGHYRRYSKSALSKLLERLPVEIHELNYFFPEMLPFGIIRKLRDSGGGPEFPKLPGWVNAALYGLGRITYAFRGITPVGTSLIAVVTRK